MNDLDRLLIKLQEQTQLLTKQSEQVLETSELSKTCNCNNGFILSIDEKGYEVAKECPCRKQKIMQNRLRFANLPEAFKDMALSNFKTDVYKLEKSQEVINTVIGILKLYLVNLESHKATGKGLYIYSDTKGSGKTRIAVSLASELMKKYNMQVKFSTSTSILNEIKRTWDRDNEYNESDLLDALSTTQVLIIDDFGTEEVRGWIDEKFYSIINERYQNKKITIYTSNLPLGDLKYGDRIKSRVKETTYQIPFPEECVRDYIADRDNAEMLNKLRRLP